MRRILLALWIAAGAGCRSLGGGEVPDTELKARLETALRSRGDLDLRRVTTDVHSGVVTLSGIVPDAEQLRAIRTLAARVRGVDQVLNNLIIQE